MYILSLFIWHYHLSRASYIVGDCVLAACKARKPDGHVCQAKARIGSDFCFFHDPELSDARRQAQCRGGHKQTRIRVIPSHTPDFHFSDSVRIKELLEYAANQLVQGELDPKSAYVLGYLADCALRAHKLITLEQRIDEVEKLIHSEKEIAIGDPAYLEIDWEGPSKSGPEQSESA
jgi:hypothetical protein